MLTDEHVDKHFGASVARIATCWRHQRRSQHRITSWLRSLQSVQAMYPTSLSGWRDTLSML